MQPGCTVSPEGTDEVIGIHLVMSLSKNTVYTNSFSLNNVMIEL